MRTFTQPDADFAYTFGPYRDPIATIQPGETVRIETVDSANGAITGPDILPSEVLGPYLNPQTGPFYIEGAEPGDTLAVKIDAIEPNRDWAFSCTIPYFGGLTSTSLTAMLQEPLPERVWIYRQQPSGGWAYEDPDRGVRWEIPWAPFFGTIGTAPHIEAISSLAPGPHGGNMDVPDVTVGNTVYLPVKHPGALFYVGDAHAAQGQGELCGVALEISARGTFTFDVIKGRSIAWPRIETPDRICAVGSARPMEDSARIAYVELIRWLVADHGWDTLDAYQLLSQAGGCYVGNMVDTTYSMVASCPKRYLPIR